MPTIQLSPAVTIDLVTKKNDLVNFPFVVQDDNGNAVNFSGYTSAKLTVKNNELGTEVISFTATGATYQIDISNRSVGAFTIQCNSLPINADEYVYDFQVSTSTKGQTIMQGKFIVQDEVTK
jgi:hypothetical protein